MRAKNQHAGIWNIDRQHSTRWSNDGGSTVSRTSTSRPGVHRVGDGSPRVPRQLVACGAASWVVVVRRRRGASAIGRDDDRRPASGDGSGGRRHEAVRGGRPLDAHRALGTARRNHQRRQRRPDRLLPAARPHQVRHLQLRT